MSDIDRLLGEIERHAKIITHHRDAPCPFWEDRGCGVSMVHDADDILKLVAELREASTSTDGRA